MDLPDSWEDLYEDVAAEGKLKSPSFAKREVAVVAQKVSKDSPGMSREEIERQIVEGEKALVDELVGDRSHSTFEKRRTVPDPKRAAAVLATKKVGGAYSENPLDAIPLNTHKECENFAENIVKKIHESTAKSPAWLRFLDIILKECYSKMDMKDVNSLCNKVKSYTTKREETELRVGEKKKKPNTDVSICRNYKEEYDMRYGEFDGEEESFDEEEYDEEEYDEDEIADKDVGGKKGSVEPKNVEKRREEGYEAAALGF